MTIHVGEPIRNGYGYKLGEAQYAIDVAFPEQMDLDESKMSMWIPFADGNRRDGVGDLLEVEGIDLSRHRKLPNVMFDHGKNLHLPIGMACERDEQGRYDYDRYTVVIDPVTRSAKLNAFFYQGKGELSVPVGKADEYDHALFCEQLYHMAAVKMLGAGSIGYQILDAREIPADHNRGTPKGLHLYRVLMLEGSLVVMPCNQDTVRKALALPRLCGKPLSPMLVKSLSPYAPERKALISVPEVKAVAKGKLAAALQKVTAECVARENDETKGGIGVWYSSDGGSVFIDVRDWGDSELGREIGKVASGFVGEENVEYGNEQSPPKDREWIKVETKALQGTKSVPVPVPLNEDLNATRVPPPRWKPGAGAIKELRRKYRKSKSVRRRLKKSSPGSSMVYLDGKDLPAVTQAAKERGIDLARVGVKDGLEKVRLTGDDNAIDELAKQYGRSLRGIKSMKVKTKDIDGNPIPGDEAETEIQRDAVADDAMDMPEKDMPTEKLSAQALRRLHEDFSLLMGDYDEILGQLEHEPIAEFMRGVLEAFDGYMSDAEGHMAKHHPDLPGLGESADKDMDEAPDEDMIEEAEEENEGEDVKDVDTEDTDAVEADSRTEEEPTPEEALDGMETKRLVRKKVKELRDRYGRKALCSGCGKSPCKCDAKQLRGLPVDTYETNGKVGLSVDGHRMVSGPFFRTEDEARRYAEKNLKQLRQRIKDLTEDEADKIEGEMDAVKDDLREETSDKEKALEPHEIEGVKQAHDFLGEMSTTQDWNDEHRMKSYHYHKTLDAIGNMEDDLEGGMKSGDAPTDYHKNMPNPSGTSHRKSCKNCAGFLGRMAREKAFGDAHREEAMYHQKALSGIVPHPEDPDGQEETAVDDAPAMNDDPELQEGEKVRMDRMEKMLERLAAVVR